VFPVVRFKRASAYKRTYFNIMIDSEVLYKQADSIYFF
jgi:hypothetical protein